MASLDLFAFLLSSAVAFVLIFYKVPTTVLQQGVALLLVILLVISRKFIFPKDSEIADSQISGKTFRLFLLILSSLFVQLLVISSGGFFSPFLITMHLYTLGVSFLLKISSAISFLVLSLMVLFASTFLNPTLFTIFKEDPGSAVIYLVSFIVIIPLAQFLMSTYHLKDTISKLLTAHIEMGEKREQSILSGLEEMVIVTDMNLKVLSFNEALEKNLNLPGEILGSSLLSVIRLKDKDGNPATFKSLSIDKVLKDRVIHIVDGFTLETKSTINLRVSIQIRPVTDPTGEINQIAFVITDVRPASLEIHSEFERAQAKQKAVFGEIREELNSASRTNESIRLLLLEKNEDDLFIAKELEDHPFRKMTAYLDLAEVCQLITVQKLPIANALGVNLKFVPTKDAKEQAYLSLKQSYLSPENLPPSEYSVPHDSRWLKVLIEKIVDIAILLVSGKVGAYVNLSLGKLEDQVVTVSINAFPVELSEAEKEDLLKEYFGNLMSKTNLRLGSGLEGFIAQIVSSNLNLPLDMQVDENILSIKFQISKLITS